MPQMNRLTLILSLLALLTFCGQKNGEKSDIMLIKEDSIILKTMLLRVKDNYKIAPVEVAAYFNNVPYKSGTLEIEGEPLVVCLNGVDCVTLVEYAIAISNSGGDEMQFFKILESLRYRKGIRNGYLSRLHYFSEWLCDNESRGNLQIVNHPFLMRQWNPNVFYMSNNIDKYSLATGYKDSLKNIETSINLHQFSVIRKDERDKINEIVQHGDIIAIVTNIKGLDITHVGFAYKKSSTVCFLHASSEKGKVIITDEPLHEYLQNKNHMQSIIIARTKKND